MTEKANSGSKDGQKSIKIGVWDEQEHSRFLRGVVEHGKEWRLVKEVIGTRQEKQIQSHFQKYLRRVAKMVKKIKRKGPHRNPEDADLQGETLLYRQLFTTADITTHTPSQIKSMIVCVCPADPASPRKERNIIITNSTSEPHPTTKATPPIFDFTFLTASSLPERTNSEGRKRSQGEHWSPRARSFNMRPRQECPKAASRRDLSMNGTRNLAVLGRSRLLRLWTLCPLLITFWATAGRDANYFLKFIQQQNTYI